MTQNGTPDTENALAERQLAALPYLASSSTLSEGARLAGIARTTLYRWCEDPYFRRELERQRSEAAELASAELSGLMLKAAQVLAEAMEHPNPTVRVRAAHVAITSGLKVGEFKALDERMDQLNDALLLHVRRSPRP